MTTTTQNKISSNLAHNISTISVHPGEVLLSEFMEPMGISQYKLAKDIGVTPIRISEIIREMRAVTADTAIRLSQYFGTSPQFWLNLQGNYDLTMCIKQNKPQIQKIIIPA